MQSVKEEIVTFCQKKFLSSITLQMMNDMREQLLDLLSGIGFLNKAKGAKACSQHLHDLEIVSAVMCAGLYPNVIQCKRRGKGLHSTARKLGKWTSILFSECRGPLVSSALLLVYSEKVKTTSIYIRDLTNISDYSLLLFGSCLTPGKTGEGITMLGGYLHFSAPKNVLQLIQVFTLFFATGVGAGLGLTVDLKRLDDPISLDIIIPGFDKFFNLIYVSSSFLLLATVTTAAAILSLSYYVGAK